jgi:hypothetical protein
MVLRERTVVEIVNKLFVIEATLTAAKDSTLIASLIALTILLKAFSLFALAALSYGFRLDS